MDSTKYQTIGLERDFCFLIITCLSCEATDVGNDCCCCGKTTAVVCRRDKSRFLNRDRERKKTKNRRRKSCFHEYY